MPMVMIGQHGQSVGMRYVVDESEEENMEFREDGHHQHHDGLAWKMDGDRIAVAEGHKKMTVELLDQIEHGAFGAVRKAKWSKNWSSKLPWKRNKNEGQSLLEVQQASIWCMDSGKGARYMPDVKVLVSCDSDSSETELIAVKETDHSTQEIRVIKQLMQARPHPNLVNHFFTYVKQDGVAVIGMEFVNGGDLYAFLDNTNQQFGLKQITRIATELTHAIGYLHSLNIMHNDIKLENVLVDANGHVKLADFGLAILLNAREHDRQPHGGLGCITSSGTLGYCAPEVLLRESHGVESDWWSFGVLLHELILGFLPFFDSSDVERTCQQICEANLTFSDSLPPQFDTLKHLITMLLQKERTNRLGYWTGVEQILQHPFYVS